MGRAEITPVSHVFSAISRGPKTPFRTIASGALKAMMRPEDDRASFWLSVSFQGRSVKLWGCIMVYQLEILMIVFLLF